MKRSKQLILAIVIFCILSSGLIAYAYGTQGRFASKIIYYTTDSSCIKAYSMSDTAAYSWTSRTNVILSRLTSPTHIYIYETNLAVTWDGLTTPVKTNGYFTYATIQINRYHSNTWNNNSALQSVINHEVGHALGLLDSSGAKLMNGVTWGTESRYGTYGIVNPQQDDISGVNSLY